MKTKFLMIFLAICAISATKYPTTKEVDKNTYFEVIKGLDKIVDEYKNSGKYDDELIKENNDLKMKLINQFGYDTFQKELELSLQKYFSSEFPSVKCANAYPCFMDAYASYMIPSCFKNNYSCKRDKWNKFIKEVTICEKRFCHDPRGDEDGDGEMDGPLPF